LVRGDLGLDQLEGDLFLHFFIESPKDPAHSADAQFFDDFIPAGENKPPGELIASRLHGHGEGRADRGIEPRGALGAILGIFRIVGLTLGAFHAVFIFNLAGRILFTKNDVKWDRAGISSKDGRCFFGGRRLRICGPFSIRINLTYPIKIVV
jgi:hypothetical protein